MQYLIFIVFFKEINFISIVILLCFFPSKSLLNNQVPSITPWCLICSETEAFIIYLQCFAVISVVEAVLYLKKVTVVASS